MIATARLPMSPLPRFVAVLFLCATAASHSHAMLEGMFLYFPTHKANRSGLADWVADDSVIGCRRTVDSPRTVWLVLHGNAGQASDRTYIVELLPADSDVHVMEYPGYGLRGGKPTMKSINQAAIAAYRSLRSRYPGVPVAVFGESLGSGPASVLCSLPDPPDRLVLVVPHDNLLSVAKKHMRLLPVGLLMRDKWDNVRALSGYRGDILIFGARHDTVIPVEHARNLARALPRSRYMELPCGHNDWTAAVAGAGID